MDEEVWKDIVGYEGLYAVSNCGRVKSLERLAWNGKVYHILKGKILKPQKCINGYLYTSLSRDGKRKFYTIHRLVLSTFSPCENMSKLDVNHIDENKLNNVLSNLEWCTRSYNNNYGTHNARVAETLRGKSNTRKSIPIVQLALDGKYIRSYKSATDAARECGGSNSGIIHCCKGNRKSHKGFKWMYLSEFLDKNCGIIE